MKMLKDLFKLTGIPVLIASLCCLTPVVLVLIGLSTVAAAASLTESLYEYKWYFRAFGFVLFLASLVVYFRRRGVCSLDQAKKHRNEILNKLILGTIAFIIFFYIFFEIILTWVGKLLKIWS